MYPYLWESSWKLRANFIRSLSSCANDQWWTWNSQEFKNEQNLQFAHVKAEMSLKIPVRVIWWFISLKLLFHWSSTIKSGRGEGRFFSLSFLDHDCIHGLLTRNKREAIIPHYIREHSLFMIRFEIPSGLQNLEWVCTCFGLNVPHIDEPFCEICLQVGMISSVVGMGSLAVWFLWAQQNSPQRGNEKWKPRIPALNLNFITVKFDSQAKPVWRCALLSELTTTRIMRCQDPEDGCGNWDSGAIDWSLCAITARVMSVK